MPTARAASTRVMAKYHTAFSAGISAVGDCLTRADAAKRLCARGDLNGRDPRSSCQNWPVYVK